MTRLVTPVSFAYKARRKEKIKKDINNDITPIGDWVEWSSEPHTPDEIRERLITKPISETCISYLCCNSVIPDDFIEEFMALSTGLFHKKGHDNLAKKQPLEYNKDNLEFVKNYCIALKTLEPDEFRKVEFHYPDELLTFYKHNRRTYTSFAQEKLNDYEHTPIGERLDWKGLNLAARNLYLRTKYQKVLDKKTLATA